VHLTPAIDGRGQLEENGGTTQAVPAARSRASSLGQVPAFCSCRPSRSRGPSPRYAGNNGRVEAAIPGDGGLIEGLGALEPVWDELYPAEQARILRLLIERSDVAPDGISVTLHAAKVRSLVAELAEQEAPAQAASEPLLAAAE
jgi:hypothetical protein